MSRTRTVGGNITKTSNGVTTIEVRGGDFRAIAGNENNWNGKGGGITHHPYVPPHPTDTLKNTIKVTLNIFFDGTQNNKTNTEAGKLHKKSNGDDDSFTNDFSNVARGYDAIDSTVTFQKKLYIEGIGTEDLESDTVFPDIALGMGDRGILAKVVKACVKAPEMLEEYNDKEIDILFINVYGFSRGAAAARHFLHVAHSPAIIYSKQPNNMVQIAAPGHYQGMLDSDAILNVQESPLLDKHGYFAACLLDKGFKIKSIQINFVGLYDTVASHGFYHGNDVKDLHLTAIKKARFALQLSADDEYRENFDLTNITSAGLHGLELTLPGVHSDIGGSYANKATEVSALYYKRESIYNQMIHKSTKVINRFKEIVVSEGWYKEKQLKAGSLHKSDIDFKKKKDIEDSETFYALVGTRELYNTYDQIPLNLMFHFSKDSGVEYRKDKLKDSAVKDEFIQTVKNHLDHYINACNNLRNNYVVGYNDPLSNRDYIDIEYLEKLQKLSYLDYIDVEILKELRNKYLHWSVKANEMGLGSRVSQAPSREGALEEKYRKREIHNG